MLRTVYSHIRSQWMGALALFLVLGGGVAFAAFNPIGSDGDLDLCFERRSGDLDIMKGKKCSPGERSFAINQTGPRGPQGVQGVPGEQGLPGPATGPAGGDLTGNYPDPQIAPGAVTEAELGCGSDPSQQMVKVGSFCIDKYEASVWDSPTGGSQLTTEAQIDASCPNNGQPSGPPTTCTNFYARSVSGVEPAHDITWFQAQQALANSGKRLPSSAEWQQAVSGTPDTGGADSGPPSCNTDSTLAVANTGSRANCVSRFGAFDMVGNLWEWVGDWLPRADAACGSWPFSDDIQCIVGAATTGEPGALIRGGDFSLDTGAGPFAVSADAQPSSSGASLGFRGAR